MEEKKKLVVGISGASGAPIAVLLLKALQEQPEWESHLVISESGEETIRQETGLTPGDVRALADVRYGIHDVGAAIASGTFRTAGMAVVPCSMKTVAGIAGGYSDNLLLRAADVALKERRRLVLVARETPMHSIHLRNLLALSDMGAVIAPPMLTYYNRPADAQDMALHMVGKILDLFGVDFPRLRRWNPEIKGSREP